MLTGWFWLIPCEVTRGQFRPFVAATGYKIDAERHKTEGRSIIHFFPHGYSTFMHSDSRNHPSELSGNRMRIHPWRVSIQVTSVALCSGCSKAGS